MVLIFLHPGVSHAFSESRFFRFQVCTVQVFHGPDIFESGSWVQVQGIMPSLLKLGCKHCIGWKQYIKIFLTSVKKLVVYVVSVVP